MLLRHSFAHIVLVVLFLVLIEFLCHQPMIAQDSTNQSKQFFWASFGVGGGSLGLAGDFRLSYQNSDHRFSFRTSGTFEFIILGPSPVEEVTDYALLYGRSFDDDHITGAISAGIGIVRSVRRGKFIAHHFLVDEYERNVNTTIGLPIEVSFIGVIFPVFGVGIEAFGDVNKARTFGGILLTIHFGKLK